MSVPPGLSELAAVTLVNFPRPVAAVVAEIQGWRIALGEGTGRGGKGGKLLFRHDSASNAARAMRSGISDAGHNGL